MKLKPRQELTCSVNEIVAPGTGLVKLDTFPIFISGALPGDKVTIRISKKKRNYAQGKIISFIEKSPLRTETICSNFPECGGCQLIDTKYKKQVELKESVFSDAVQQFYPELKPHIKSIIACEQQTFYRNKMEYSFAHNEEGKVILGLKKRATFDQVIELDSCLLQSDISNEIRHFTEAFFTKHKISTWNYHTHEGALRHLMLRDSKTSQDIMLNLVVSNNDDKVVFQLYSEEIAKAFPLIKSIFLSIQPEISDTAKTNESQLLYGNPHLIEILGNLRFKISPQSFFQTNSLQASVLYETIVKTAQLTSSDIVLDLYCGTGTIGLYFAKHVKKVIGIEEIPQAIEDAKINAKLNQISNADFICGNVKNILKFNTFNVDCIITDPPRSGMSNKAIKRLLELNAKQIIYVSCNPMTLIRDLKTFNEYGYNIDIIQPVDMFPNTFHIEAIVKCSKAS